MNEETRYRLMYFYDELLEKAKSGKELNNYDFYFDEVVKIIPNEYFYECYQVIKRILSGKGGISWNVGNYSNYRAYPLKSKY